MTNLTWTEIFYSLQGEGARVGSPSIFIRMWGCNFTCDGFSMPPKEKSTERFDIDPTQYKKFEDLPLVSTGCDSYSSFDKRFRHLANKGPISEMVGNVVRVVLDKTKADKNKRPLKGIEIVMTGGEPLLGWQKLYPQLFRELISKGVRNFTFETNGTQTIKPAFQSYLNKYGKSVTWSISPKLPESGNCLRDSIKPLAVKSMVACPGTNGFFKFVISRDKSIKHVEMALRKYKEEGIELPVYLMPVGGTPEEYDRNKKNVAQACLEHKWNYSPRLQVDLFGNKWGT